VVGGAATGALEQGRADHRSRFCTNQLLVEPVGRGPDPVGDIGEFQLSKKFEQGKLVGSHRGP